MVGSLFCIAIALVFGGHAYAATSLDVAEVIRQLDESGQLDKVVERALERISERQREAQAQEEKNQEEMRSKLAENVRPINAERDHILGKPDADVTIFLYSDFECPYCKRFHLTPQKVVKDLGGVANLVWRHFPLDFHEPMATKEAVASICAGQQGGNRKFWEFTDAVMEGTKSNAAGLPAVKGFSDPLIALARSLNINITKFNECIKSPSATARVKEDVEDGAKSGISGTPGVIIRNNKTGKTILVAGAVPEVVLIDHINNIKKD